MATDPSNPLCTVRFDIPFDAIRAEHVEPAIAALIAQAEADVAAIAGLQGPRTYDNTVAALERATEPLEWAMGIVGHLESVATTPALRAAYNAAQPLASAFFSALPLNAGLFAALGAFADTDEARALPEAQARFLRKTLADFRRHGALLDDAGKQRLRDLDVELAQLCTRYAQNLLDATNAFELHIPAAEEARLRGLPESARLLARHSAEQKGLPGSRLTLHEPSLGPALTYLDDGALREALWRAANTRATSGERDNRALIRRILALRAEKARLLGFGDFADLVLEDRMAKRGAQALGFVDDLRARSQAAFEREAAALWEFRRGLEGPAAPRPMPWDTAYYAEKQRQALYDFDEEALRPYLPAGQVLAGLFELAERLYGVRVVELSGVPAWDAAVRTFAIYEGGEPGPAVELCRFYVDLHPRENKRGGAWMNALYTGTPQAPAGPRHLGLFCANVQPPVGGRPSLLTHREVETLFHEFGHLLHHALTQVPVRSLAGTNVAWDFVELPSQFMENFCWEREILDRVARHFETGAPIPEELFQRMQRARTYRAATAMMRQLGFATVDLHLHTRYQPERDGDVMAYARAVLQAHAPAPLPEDYAMIAGFGHLFASPVGYAAGYYSYKWAEVLDADAFERFKEDDAGAPRPFRLDARAREVGQAFRQHILARGDSREPQELYQAFRGRPPKQDALLIRSGLL